MNGNKRKSRKQNIEKKKTKMGKRVRYTIVQEKKKNNRNPPFTNGLTGNGKGKIIMKRW